MPDSDFTVTFLGVGGSCSAGDRRRVRYGSNTSCVLVRVGERPIILDMGTGLVRLTGTAGNDVLRGADILLSHFHYDHIEGMPFFEPLFVDGRFDIYARPPETSDVKTTITNFFKDPYLPIKYNYYNAELHCHDLLTPSFTTATGIEVSTMPLNHPGGCTGYRIEYDGHVLVYLSDHEHTGDETATVQFSAGADLIIYDAHFTRAEYDTGRFIGWGHSHHEAGLKLAETAGAGRIAFTHHAIWRTDDELDELEQQCKA